MKTQKASMSQTFINGMPRFQRLIALLLTLIVIGVSFYTQASVTPLPGKVRVLLTEFQKLTQIEIGIHGAYSLDEKTSFQKGSRIQVAVVNDSLQVSYEGMVYLAGKSLLLKQHQSENHEEAGLRLAGQMNLYPGDLLITQKNGELELITSLPIERYLQGVVPYEMADEFPLEALKAQAVAARTYTLSHLEASQHYDLVDNTNDQVYRGINNDKVNAIKAVRETSGLVLYYQNRLANCLYTASNGGYTESAFNAWGREHIPYLNIKKDPYDLENPLSIVRSANIPKTPGDKDEAQATVFYQHILGILTEQIKASGAAVNDLSIQFIKAMTPHTPKDAKHPNGVMTKLRVDLVAQSKTMVEVRNTDNDTEISLTAPQNTEPVNQSGEQKQYVEKTELKEYALDLPVFPDVEQLLGLSINRNENEIISVVESEHEFKVQFRRYGHGVGMSQRGAEWMAKSHQQTFEQILQFYYPGTDLKKHETFDDPLPTLAAAFLTTPGPPPTATPRPTLMPQSQKPLEGQSLAHVTGIETNSSLNLRSKPDYLGDIVTRLYYGQELLVLKRLEDGWLEVKTDAVQGFIREEFVIIQ